MNYYDDLLALSIMQPWAWLICADHKDRKDIENRQWWHNNPGLKKRGKFLIHTGVRYDTDFSALGLPDLARQVPPRNELPMGGIVGVAEIVDCVKEHTSPWFFGPYGFVLKNVEPLPFRPCVGRLGFFKPDYSLQYKERLPKKEKPTRKEAPKKVSTMNLFGESQ